ncbi:alpha/beta fold hydrolase [bacterium]|nr:alpha/beta fold hydrolase [bacterium]
MDEGYVKIQNGELFYQKVGDGDPIIVVHGGPGLDHIYLKDHIADKFPSKQLIFYDQRGCSKSLSKNSDKEEFSIKQFVEDLEELRKALGLSKITLLGHSWGARVSLYYALRYQENISFLILLSVPPFTKEGEEVFAKNAALFGAPIQEELTMMHTGAFFSLSKKEINDWYAKIFREYFYDKSLARKLVWNFEEEAAKSGMRSHGVLMAEKVPTKEEFLRLIGSLEVRTLILHGENDITPVEIAKELASWMKNATLITLKSCGHFPFVEKPKEFKAQMERSFAAL